MEHPLSRYNLLHKKLRQNVMASNNSHLIYLIILWVRNLNLGKAQQSDSASPCDIDWVTQWYLAVAYGLENPTYPPHTSEALWWGWLKAGLNWSASTWPLPHDGLRALDSLQRTSALPESVFQGNKGFFWPGLERYAVLTHTPKSLDGSVTSQGYSGECPQRQGWRGD